MNFNKYTLALALLATSALAGENTGDKKVPAVATDVQEDSVSSKGSNVQQQNPDVGENNPLSDKSDAEKGTKSADVTTPVESNQIPANSAATVENKSAATTAAPQKEPTAEEKLAAEKAAKDAIVAKAKDLLPKLGDKITTLKAEEIEKHGLDAKQSAAILALKKDVITEDDLVKILTPVAETKAVAEENHFSKYMWWYIGGGAVVVIAGGAYAMSRKSEETDL